MDTIWLVCMILATISMGFAIKSMFSAKQKSLNKIVKTVLYLAETSFILYVPIFFLQNNFLTALAADMINVMRVVTMDAGYLDNKDFIMQNIGTDGAYRLYMLLMGLMHFLMPLLSIMAVYSIFFMFFSHIRIFFINLRMRRPVFIFNTASDKAVLMAADIQEHVPKGSFIFAGIKDKVSGEDADALNSTVVFPDSIENVKIKRNSKKDVSYFLISDVEDQNVRDAMDQIKIICELSDEIQQHTHIFVGVASNEAEVLIDSANKGKIDVRVLRGDEIAVYNLLDEHPLYDSVEDNVLSVLVVGLDVIGESAVKAVGWCAQTGAYKVKINVVGVDIADKIDEFRFKYPGYADCDCLELNFYNCSGNQELMDTIARKCDDTTYVIVATGADMENAVMAVRLRREFLKHNGEQSHKPEIYAYIRDKDEANVLSELKTSGAISSNRVSYDIVPFGSDEDVYNYENFYDSDRECLGINVHLVNESLRCNGELDVSAAMERYNSMEVFKRSNIASAMHMRYKLSCLCLDYSCDPDAVSVDYSEYLTDEELEQLTRAEHDRWRMFMIADGWTGVDMADMEEYRELVVKTGEYISQIKKVHPYICPFDELKARSEYLGVGDEVEYDREMILNIPDILHDKWDVTGVKYKIIKKK